MESKAEKRVNCKIAALQLQADNTFVKTKNTLLALTPSYFIYGYLTLYCLKEVAAVHYLPPNAFS